jgi:antitoxin component YwqK of YwqJK toxin-antitoxin module
VNNIPAYNAANLNVHLQNGVLLQGNSPFTGIIYALQANNKDTSEIVSFKQGLEHGLWKKFYPGNKLMEKRYFSNGRKIGEYDVWWPNGAVKLIYHFKDGELDGNCRAWTDKGLLIEDMNYKSGYEDGKQEQFYDDGRVKANYVITDGRRYGLLGTKNCVNVTDSIFKK